MHTKLSWSVELSSSFELSWSVDLPLCTAGPSIVASRVVGSLFKTRSSTTLRLGAHSHDAMLATVRAAQIAPVADSNRASGRHRSRRWPTHVAHLADSDFIRRKPEQGSHQNSSPGGRTRRGKNYPDGASAPAAIPLAEAGNLIFRGSGESEAGNLSLIHI